MTKCIPLWDGDIPAFCPEADTPNNMMAYLLDTPAPAPAVIIFPGGAYTHRAYHEGEPVAQFYNRCGFQAFVVDYRVAPNRAPAPLADAKRAIRLVRANAAAWGVDPERVFVCGFSAGGNLAACTAVLPDDPTVKDDLSAISSKPTGAVLCYPVISGLEQDGHSYSHHMLLDDRYEKEVEHYSLQLQVDEHTAPCFLWHTAEDNAVPVRHSLMMANALRTHGVPFELHVFPHGCHGLGLSDPADAEHYEPGVNRWAELSAEWIRTF